MSTDYSHNINSKKVFFVQPNSVIQKELISVLIQHEYEAILIPNAEKAKKIFNLYPDCLAFLNIDEGLSESEWQDFAKEIQSNPAFKFVKLGILTYNTDPDLAKKYLMDLSVPCGFIKLSLNLEESTNVILKALDANEARGRRKYLRVKCDEKAKINFKLWNKTVDGQILDISSVGMCCTFSPLQPVKKHSSLESIQLLLKTMRCIVNGVVMGSRHMPHDRTLIYVILFDSNTSGDYKSKIRNYIQLTLQESIDAELRT